MKNRKFMWWFETLVLSKTL